MSREEQPKTLEDNSNELYSVGPVTTSDSSQSPPTTVKLHRHFGNPYVKSSQREQMIIHKHEAILQSYSSHLRVPTSTKASSILSPGTDEYIQNQISKKARNEDDSDSDSSSDSDNGNDDIDIDETTPIAFEFPYYLNTTKRSLLLMAEYFENDNRVEALKIAIQTSRFLIDNIVLTETQFYPAIYVLVSKVLDKLSHLVYARLEKLALHGTERPRMMMANYLNSDDEKTLNMDDYKNYMSEMKENDDCLPSNFSCTHCSLLSQIKCQNWFYKISAIRELVPRILIEISLYRSLRFIYPLQEILRYSKVLVQRLRGISNPLISCYVRLFALEQIFAMFGTISFSLEIDNDKMNKYEFDMISDIYLTVLHDILFIFKQMNDTNFMFIECVFYGQMASEDYLSLFNPVFELIFEILQHNQVFENINDLQMYLYQNIKPELLKQIDLNSFLGIKNEKQEFALNLSETNNSSSNSKSQRKSGVHANYDDLVKFGNRYKQTNDSENNDDTSDDAQEPIPNNNNISEMAKNFQNTNTTNTV